MTQQIAVGLLDNDPLSLASLVLFLNRTRMQRPYSAIQVIWSTTSPSQALYNCLFDRKPDVLVTDLAMQGINGAMLCERIRLQNSTMRFICITSYPCQHYLDDVILAGAQALISKEFMERELPDAIVRTYDEDLESYLPFQSPRMSHIRLTACERKPRAAFSPNEQQVIRLLLRGEEPRSIAECMHISVDTVNTYVHRAIKKVGAANRKELLSICRKYDLG